MQGNRRMVPQELVGEPRYKEKTTQDKAEWKFNLGMCVTSEESFQVDPMIQICRYYKPEEEVSTDYFFA